MTDDNKPTHDETENDVPADAAEDDVMKNLLRRSLKTTGEGSEAGPMSARRSLLPAVQKKIRERSKGKFFADCWSTGQTKVSYATIAVIMLVILAISYFALGPTGVTSH